jgi:hypothetical protein
MHQIQRRDGNVQVAASQPRLSCCTIGTLFAEHVGCQGPDMEVAQTGRGFRIPEAMADDLYQVVDLNEQAQTDLTPPKSS